MVCDDDHFYIYKALRVDEKKVQVASHFNPGIYNLARQSASSQGLHERMPGKVVHSNAMNDLTITRTDQKLDA
jgi:hypothetical protein